MQPLRYIVLGAGGIAHAHVDGFSKLEQVTPVGFCDVNADALRRWKERFPQAEIDHDPAKLLARTNPDIVSVCSPNVAHHEHVIAALRAGAHVLCEKPMAMNLAQAQQMESARQAARKLGAINFSYRHNPSFRFARELVRDGEIGRVHRVNVRYLQGWMAAETARFAWRYDAAVAGFGTVGDLGVHMLDGVAFVTGLKPRRLVGMTRVLIPSRPDHDGKPRVVTADTHANFLVDYDGDALGTFETSQATPGYGNHFVMEVSGDRGVLRFSSEDGENITLYAGRSISRFSTWKREEFPRFNIPSDFINRQPKSTMEVFVRAIRGEQVEYASFADGVAAQKCLEAITESIQTGAWANVS